MPANALKPKPPPLDPSLAQLLRRERDNVAAPAASKAIAFARLSAKLSAAAGVTVGAATQGSSATSGAAGASSSGAPAAASVATTTAAAGGATTTGGGAAASATAAVGALGYAKVVAIVAVGGLIATGAASRIGEGAKTSVPPVAVTMPVATAGDAWGRPVANPPPPPREALPEEPRQEVPTSRHVPIAAVASGSPPPSPALITRTKRELPRATTDVPLPTPAGAPSTRSGSADLADEQRLLDAAREGLRRGDAQAALASALEHERRYPHGQFEAQREVVLVRALATSGRMAEARERAERFRRRFPTSMYLTTIDRALEATTTPP